MTKRKTLAPVDGLFDQSYKLSSNKIENIFQKTFPKSVKKLMKIKKGLM